MPLRFVSSEPTSTGLVITIAADTFPELNDDSACRRMAVDVASQWCAQPIIVSQETQVIGEDGKPLPRQTTLEAIGHPTFRRVITFASTSAPRHFTG